MLRQIIDCETGEVSIIEVENEMVEQVEPDQTVQQLADALANLPQETLDALKGALGI